MKRGSKVLLWIAGVIVVLATLAVVYAFGIAHGMWMEKQAFKDGTTGIATATIEQQEDSEWALYLLTNEERSKAGLDFLNYSPYLAASALEKCNDMVKRDYWSHNTPDDATPQQFIDKYYDYSQAGENLAYGYKTPIDVVEGWMKSKTHRENLLGNKYKDVGFAACSSPNFISKGKQIIVVQHFGTQ